MYRYWVFEHPSWDDALHIEMDENPATVAWEVAKENLGGDEDELELVMRCRRTEYPVFNEFGN